MRKRLIVAGAAALAGVGVALGFAPRAPDPARPAGGGPHAADAAAGARVFRQCAACHSMGRNGVDLDGPNLYGVVGSPVGARRPRYAYSAALRHAGGLWTPDRLDRWLTRPTAFAPGTTMPFAGLPDPADRADVIAFLAAQGPGAATP